MANLTIRVEDQSEKKARLSSSRRYRNRRTGQAYSFLLPYILFMLAFGLGPGSYAFLISFADYSTGLPRYFAAGIKNYLTVFGFPVGIYFRQHRRIPAHFCAHWNCHRGIAGVAPAHAARAGCIHPADAFLHSRCSFRPCSGASGHFYVDPASEPIWFLA